MKRTGMAVVMGRVVSLLILFLLFSINFTYGSAVEPRVIPLAANDSIQLYLEVAPEADVLDDDWLRLRIDNNTGRDLAIQELFYNITRDRGDIVTGLASGSDFDLFPDCWQTMPVAPRILPPGTTVKHTEPSLYAAAMLGGERGNINASVVFEIYFEDGSSLETPAKGIPFSFQWNGGGESREAVQRVAREMLSHPLTVNPPASAHYLNTLLDVAPLERYELLAARQALAADPLERDARHWIIRRALAKCHERELAAAYHRKLRHP